MNNLIKVQKLLSDMNKTAVSFHDKAREIAHLVIDEEARTSLHKGDAKLGDVLNPIIKDIRKLMDKAAKGHGMANAKTVNRYIKAHLTIMCFPEQAIETKKATKDTSAVYTPAALCKGDMIWQAAKQIRESLGIETGCTGNGANKKAGDTVRKLWSDVRYRDQIRKALAELGYSIVKAERATVAKAKPAVAKRVA